MAAKFYNRGRAIHRRHIRNEQLGGTRNKPGFQSCETDTHHYLRKLYNPFMAPGKVVIRSSPAQDTYLQIEYEKPYNTSPKTLHIPDMSPATGFGGAPFPFAEVERPIAFYGKGSTTTVSGPRTYTPIAGQGYRPTIPALITEEVIWP